MSAVVQAPGAIVAPDVTQAEIDWFHEAHFSGASVKLFERQFLQLGTNNVDVQHYEECEDEYYEEEDDGLGYYSDGVKRTLTDEQIAIFRHSELEALRRVESKVAKHKAESASMLQEVRDDDAAEDAIQRLAGSPASDPPYKEDESEVKLEKVDSGSEDGEIEEEQPQLTKGEIRRRKKQRARQRRGENRKFVPEKKPDLRKRTWDVVEAGMDSLYYDEVETAQEPVPNPAAQRRKISYDD
ncbi:hypothetical protein F4780DRAFT_784017 [Xylariomycetidae sp. FL0641]|nr:hypothetical protein F4780DRAFT_784017 [Xylariomycetidae sp. FL0641]